MEVTINTKKASLNIGNKKKSLELEAKYTDTKDYNDLKNKPSINDIEVVGNKNGHDYNLANLDDLIASNIATSEPNKSVADVLEKKVSIGSFSGLSPGLSITKAKQVRMVYAKGGAANYSGTIYKAFESCSMFMYYIIKNGTREDFVFPSLSAFDIYDGKYIIRQSSDAIDISEVGEYEEYALDGLSTSYICVRTTFENLGITNYASSDGSESNAWLSFISGCCYYVAFSELSKQTFSSITTKDNYVYILIPASLYANQTGTVTEKVRAVLTASSMNKLIYRTNKIETTEHGETVLDLSDSSIVNFLTFPNMLEARFSYVPESIFEQITKINTSTNTKTVCKADDVGNVNLSVAEFQKTTMIKTPTPALPEDIFKIDPSANATITSASYAGVSQDNVLYCYGLISFVNLKPFKYGRYHILELPATIANKAQNTGFDSFLATVTVAEKGSVTKPSTKPQDVHLNGEEGLFCAVDLEGYELTSTSQMVIRFQVAAKLI